MAVVDVDKEAKIIWDYMHMKQPLHKADVIIAIGGMDTSPAEYAAELYKQGYAKRLMFSGGLGSQTKDLFDKPEAEVYVDIAVAAGVPREKIIIENKSSNTGENIRFSHRMLTELNIKPGSIILVQKPYFERRAYATFKKQWPDPSAEILVTSPPISYEDYFRHLPKDKVINIMVGDLQRIREYPKLGYQIEQEIPKQVWTAYEKLVAEGFNKHLIA